MAIDPKYTENVRVAVEQQLPKIVPAADNAHAAGQLVVLVRVGDRLLAVDSTCTRCEAPLACGVLIGARPTSVFGSAKGSSVRNVPAVATGRPRSRSGRDTRPPGGCRDDDGFHETALAFDCSNPYVPCDFDSRLIGPGALSKTCRQGTNVGFGGGHCFVLGIIVVQPLA